MLYSKFTSKGKLCQTGNVNVRHRAILHLTLCQRYSQKVFADTVYLSMIMIMLHFCMYDFFMADESKLNRLCSINKKKLLLGFYYYYYYCDHSSSY